MVVTASPEDDDEDYPVGSGIGSGMEDYNYGRYNRYNGYNGYNQYTGYTGYNGYGQRQPRTVIYQLRNTQSPISSRSKFRRLRFNTRRRQQMMNGYDYDQQRMQELEQMQETAPSKMVVGPLESWAIYQQGGRVTLKRTINPPHKHSIWTTQRSPMMRPGGTIKLWLTIKNAFLLQSLPHGRSKLWRLPLYRRRAHWRRVSLSGLRSVSHLAPHRTAIFAVSARDGTLWAVDHSTDQRFPVSVPDNVAVGQVAVSGSGRMVIADRNGVLYESVGGVRRPYARMRWRRILGMRHLRSVQILFDGSIVGVDPSGRLVIGRPS